ncbi:MAG: DUF3179 domain-containing protein [Pseudomonadota bacterium]
MSFRLPRRTFVSMAAAGALTPGLSMAQDLSDPVERALYDQLFGDEVSFLAAMEFLQQRNDPDVAAALIMSMRFAGRRSPAQAMVLAALTGENFGTDWYAWMLWQEAHPEIKPHPFYAQLMRDTHLRIDPHFDRFLQVEEMTAGKPKIRIEEIVWGGVVKDGIPSLDNPELIEAEQADYMRGDDLVFGVSINGDSRAYPLRIMGWHEMFNEVIGGVPVALAYCTLCGSGILFETQVEGRAEPLIFGSSGFLYRSNKLMFDRETHSLWNQFTGRPVMGPLVDSGIALTQRPVVITTWDNWTAGNPTTRVLSLNTGYRRNYASGEVYKEYFASPDLMFPALVDQSEHAQKDHVFTIRAFGAARAWPLKAFADAPVINDRIAGTDLVLLGDPAARAVRAYERQGQVFDPSADGASDLVDGQGRIWSVTEEALIGPGGSTLPRVAGHIAYWFAWNNYLGDAASVYPD